MADLTPPTPSGGSPSRSPDAAADSAASVASRDEAWQANLQALAQVDRALADRLAALALPSSIQPARGRDGTQTWRLVRSDGSSEWFGRTSMPSISAEGLLSRFDAGAGNVALAGIGCGLEAKLLSERLGQHRAVVVLETEPLNLALALRLWNVAGAIRGRQIIFIVAEDLPALGRRLAEFCESHVGFDLPAAMLAWPWRSNDENQAYQMLLEQVASQVRRSRQQRAQAMLEILSRSGRQAGPPKAVAVCTAVPGVATGRLAGWLAEGAESLGLGAACCWPESPLQAGSLASLDAAVHLAERQGPVQVVLVDQVRAGWPWGEVDGLLIGWLASAISPSEAHKPTAGKDDWVVASTEAQREGLLRLGWRPDRVVRLPAAISPRIFQDDGAHERQDVVVLSDLPPDQAEHAGVRLYSQRMLWESLQKRIAQRCDTWQPAEAADALRAAQRETGLELTDPTVREQFLEHVRQCLVPAVLMRRLAAALCEAHLPVRIYGRGWQQADFAGQATAGPMDDPARRIEVLRRAKVVILGHCRPGTAWLALEAAAAGAAILAREIWPDSGITDLFEPGREVLTFQSRRELIEQVKRLLENESARSDLAEKARQRAKAEHTTAVRLQEILQITCNAP